MKSTEPTNESPESLESTSTVVALGTYTDNATITRTKIETKNTLLSSFISGVASIFHSIWTFILFILSKVLTHPALIQVLLLIFIVYIFYRIARRMGSRPN